jgi:thiamine-monophosphate kinase
VGGRERSVARGEEGLVAWLRRQQSGDPSRLPGDDAAIVGRGAAARAMTVDQQIAGVHVPSDLDVAVWARRLLAVNLSDLAAMGATPETALLTLAIPPGFDARRFLKALLAACRKRHTVLAGGDTARSTTAVTTLTVLGRRPPGGRWVYRSAARPGDRLWLGGPLGLSALGQRLVARGARLEGTRLRLSAELAAAPWPPGVAAAVRRHLAPRPQLDLGRWLASRRRAACIDVSDGLGRDLHRLCRASDVGAVVTAEALPWRRLEPLAARLGESALELTLGGGEDYVLLFALPPRVAPPARLGAYPIGHLTAEPEVVLEAAGERRCLPAGGWDHLA